MQKVIEYLKMQQTLIFIEIQGLKNETHEVLAGRCRNLEELRKEMPEAIRVLEKHLDK